MDTLLAWPQDWLRRGAGTWVKRPPCQTTSHEDLPVAWALCGFPAATAGRWEEAPSFASSTPLKVPALIQPEDGGSAGAPPAPLLGRTPPGVCPEPSVPSRELQTATCYVGEKGGENWGDPTSLQQADCRAFKYQLWPWRQQWVCEGGGQPQRRRHGSPALTTLLYTILQIHFGLHSASRTKGHTEPLVATTPLLSSFG